MPARRRGHEGHRRAAARLGVKTVTGFTGSSIWKAVAMFPPASEAMIDAGYQDFADRWNPILDVFDEVGVRFALEVHPSEIAYDYWTTKRTLEAIGHRATFGLNFDPSHFIWQDLDPVMFLQDFADHILHVHVKESVRQLDGRNGRLGSHLAWADPRRGWDFVTAGHGDVQWEQDLPHPERHRVHGPHQHRMGRRRHGPADRRAASARPGQGPRGHRPARRSIRRRLHHPLNRPHLLTKGKP